MKAVNMVKIAGITATVLLFVSLLSTFVYHSATYIHIGNKILERADFDITRASDMTMLIFPSITYTLLLLPWILYFLKLDKKSGLQYFSFFPMSGKRTGKIAAIALTALNVITAIGFYILMIQAATSDSNSHTDWNLSVLTMLCMAIIFWGGTYLIYGSLYGVRRFKEIVKRKREKRRLRREAQNNA